MSVKPTGGGRFDPDEGFAFFIAAQNIQNAVQYHPWTLMAVNELSGESGMREFRLRSTPPGKMFLDSGIFWLSTRHAAAHGLTMDQALAVKPEDIDGFDDLLARYVDLVNEFEPTLWGYVELDQGGPEGKRRTRAYLESIGLHPIPVYHPLTDGFDYFEELLDSYDRICIGNVVMADAATRRALLTMVWERRRRHKNTVWLHALGYTPNSLFTSYPINSADSSTHVMALRYRSTMCQGRAMLAQYGTVADPALSYDGGELLQDTDRGQPKKKAMLAWIARTDVEAWRRQWADLQRVLGPVEPWPAPYPGELDPKAAAA
jgi:hypothetical protein